MGGAGLLALGNLTGGRWAAAARPFYLATMQTLPLIAMLFAVVALNLARIYPSAPLSHTAFRESLSAAKAEYLSPNFFLIRSGTYFVLWFVAWLMLARDSRLDVAPASTRKMRRAGALSLVLLIPTTTFAAFDWAMSLEPHWYSSIYGALLTAGGVVAAMALAIIGLAIAAVDKDIIRLPAGDGEREEIVLADIFNDLGNLLLTFVMLWAYFAFSQFLIIWSGNLPDEIVWYERRLVDGWGIVGLLAAVFFFAMPFVMLLSREGKRRAKYLLVVASIALAAFAMNMAWTIVPAFSATWRTVALNACALVAISGLWLALYCRQIEPRWPPAVSLLSRRWNDDIQTGRYAAKYWPRTERAECDKGRALARWSPCHDGGRTDCRRGSPRSFYSAAQR